MSNRNGSDGNQDHSKSFSIVKQLEESEIRSSIISRFFWLKLGKKSFLPPFWYAKGASSCKGA